MESGAQSLVPIGPTAEVWQEPYDQLVQFANCSQNDSYSCLKELPTDQLLRAREQLTSMISKAYGSSIFVYGNYRIHSDPLACRMKLILWTSRSIDRRRFDPVLAASPSRTRLFRSYPVHKREQPRRRDFAHAHKRQERLGCAGDLSAFGAPQPEPHHFPASAIAVSRRSGSWLAVHDWKAIIWPFASFQTFGSDVRRPLNSKALDGGFCKMQWNKEWGIRFGRTCSRHTPPERHHIWGRTMAVRSYSFSVKFPQKAIIVRRT